jgi:hypothetical protein
MEASEIESDPLRVLTMAADQIKNMPFSFLDTLAELACESMRPMETEGSYAPRGYLDDSSIGRSAPAFHVCALPMLTILSISYLHVCTSNDLVLTQSRG